MGKRIHVLREEKPFHHVYRGCGLNTSINIVATSKNEAYALLLDAGYGYDSAGIVLMQESCRKTIRQLRTCPAGIYSF